MTLAIILGALGSILIGFMLGAWCLARCAARDGLLWYNGYIYEVIPLIEL